ncbi:MAG TPA: hypothetical protein VFL94_03845 [Actinomycetales bacterium]|nr:hypothetical protein [Actinomycetales bacterium]
MDHEPARWSRTARPLHASPLGEPGADVRAARPPQQLHLASQGYPVRIRRAIVAGGLALALAVGGALAASLSSGSMAPTSGQNDAVVTQRVDTGS